MQRYDKSWILYVFSSARVLSAYTMEQLVAFVPALWIFGWLVDPVWAAGFGVVFIIGRFIYWSAYRKDPASRGAGFTITFLPTAVMLVWALIDAVRSYL